MSFRSFAALQTAPSGYNPVCDGVNVRRHQALPIKSKKVESGRLENLIDGEWQDYGKTIAASSQALLPDVSRAMAAVARRRNDRKTSIERLLRETKSERD